MSADLVLENAETSHHSHKLDGKRDGLRLRHTPGGLLFIHIVVCLSSFPTVSYGWSRSYRCRVQHGIGMSHTAVLGKCFQSRKFCQHQGAKEFSSSKRDPNKTRQGASRKHQQTLTFDHQPSSSPVQLNITKQHDGRLLPYGRRSRGRPGRIRWWWRRKQTEQEALSRFVSRLRRDQWMLTRAEDDDDDREYRRSRPQENILSRLRRDTIAIAESVRPQTF